MREGSGVTDILFARATMVFPSNISECAIEDKIDTCVVFVNEKETVDE